MLAAPRRALLALVLVALTLVSGACGKQSSGRLPGPASSGGLSATAPGGALQEVAPPGAVQQLNERLNERVPQVSVIAPADNTLLPAGPWTLKLQVRDWPLSEAGTLGPGPHLVVQLDDQEPLRVTSAEAAANLTMPPLTPGSHRVTVYAARPWGEAVKAPGASAQIRLHRVARNPAQLPASGTAQLIAASPDDLQQAEPVLIDWLLLDAPLQNLRGDDASWRLRVSVNGDSFLVDRQTPLWLKGFKRGSNAVQLELLDGRGDPLNPPFNSLVREVVIGGDTRPAWLRPSLTASELALLSGEEPAAPEAVEPEPEPVEPEPEPVPEEPSLEPEATQPEIEPETEDQTAQPEAAEPNDSATISALTPDAEAEADATPQPDPINATEAAPEPETPPTPEAEPETEAEPASEQPTPAAAAETDRIAPQTRLSGSAREQVNADGGLQQPPARGPLAGLREKLGG
jgi:hypothetical protein